MSPSEFSTQHPSTPVDWTTGTAPRDLAIQRILLGGIMEHYAATHTVEGDVDFPALVRSVGSGSEKTLAQAAWSIFDGGCNVCLDDVVCHLDGDNFERVMDAIRLARGYQPGGTLR